MGVTFTNLSICVLEIWSLHRVKLNLIFLSNFYKFTVIPQTLWLVSFYFEDQFSPALFFFKNKNTRVS